MQFSDLSPVCRHGATLTSNLFADQGGPDSTIVRRHGTWWSSRHGRSSTVTVRNGRGSSCAVHSFSATVMSGSEGETRWFFNFWSTVAVATCNGGHGHATFVPFRHEIDIDLNMKFCSVLECASDRNRNH